MKRMISCTALIMAVVSGLLIAGDVARADHYEYRAQDPNLTTTFGLRRFQAMDQWVHSSTYLRWKADSGVRSSVIAAIGNWEADVPDIEWTEDATTPNVTFTWETSSALCSGQFGRVFVTQWAPYIDQQAQYIEEAGVCIVETPDPYTWETNGVVQVLSHEIGHLYGLHERYTDQGPIASCVSETTIMDTWTVVNDKVRHCDNISDPQGIDVLRVNNFWGEGHMADLDLSFGGGNAFVVWDDFGWGEFEHQLNYFYWNGTDWIQYAEDDTIDAIGLHKEHPEYEAAIGAVVSQRPQHGSSQYHIACGYPYFMQYGRTGTWMCSNQAVSP